LFEQSSGRAARIRISARIDVLYRVEKSFNSPSDKRRFATRNGMPSRRKIQELVEGVQSIARQRVPSAKMATQ
jgi:hypothetical protein